jgi:CheY-like chemotaxis protein
VNMTIANRKVTVLIVDDNPGVRRMLKRMIAEIDATIVECNDGAYALAAYSDHQPNLVLMDIHMPLEDGLATTRQIRTHDPSARIAIVTDYDDDELRAAASQAGACAYFVKQDLSQLAKLIRSAASDCQAGTPGFSAESGPSIPDRG